MGRLRETVRHTDRESSMHLQAYVGTGLRLCCQQFSASVSLFVSLSLSLSLWPILEPQARDPDSKPPNSTLQERNSWDYPEWISRLPRGDACPEPVQPTPAQPHSEVLPAFATRLTPSNNASVARTRTVPAASCRIVLRPKPTLTTTILAKNSNY